jgi:hypothetical protein
LPPKVQGFEFGTNVVKNTAPFGDAVGSEITRSVMLLVLAAAAPRVTDHPGAFPGIVELGAVVAVPV